MFAHVLLSTESSPYPKGTKCEFYFLFSFLREDIVYPGTPLWWDSGWRPPFLASCFAEVSEYLQILLASKANTLKCDGHTCRVTPVLGLPQQLYSEKSWHRSGHTEESGTLDEVS